MAGLALDERKGQRPVLPCQLNQSLPRAQVLRRRVDLELVSRRGRRTAGQLLALTCISRQPVTCERRVAFLLRAGIKRAVDRNRLKRRLREVYRLHRDNLPPGCDCIVRASAGAAQLDFHALVAEFLSLARGAADAC